MDTTQPRKKASQGDWHPATVIAELRIRSSLSLTRLAKKNGVTRQYLCNSLRIRNPKGDRIIADSLGEVPATVWPSRYLNTSADQRRRNGKTKAGSQP